MADASETWLPDDEEFHLEEGEEGLEGSTGASWIAFLRDDVKVQCAVWLCASAAAARHAAAPCCRGLLELGLGVSSKIPSVIGWAIASLLSLAWLLLDLQMVFTSDQRAMLFPPWSILVFVKQPVAELFSNCRRSGSNNSLSVSHQSHFPAVCRRHDPTSAGTRKVDMPEGRISFQQVHGLFTHQEDQGEIGDDRLLFCWLSDDLVGGDDSISVHCLAQMLFLRCLAACAGASNVIAFKSWHLYASHVTGSTSAIAFRIEGVHQDGVEMESLQEAVALVGSFLLGAYACGVLIDKNQVHFLGKAFYGLALILNSTLLVLAAFVPGRLFPVCLVAAACGLQNAMCTSHFGAIVRTTHVTGTVTDIGSTLGRISMIYLRKGCRRSELNDVEKAEVGVDARKLLVLSGVYEENMMPGPRALLVPASFTGTLGVCYMALRKTLKQYIQRMEKERFDSDLKEVQEAIQHMESRLHSIDTDNNESLVEMGHMIEALHEVEADFENLLRSNSQLSVGQNSRGGSKAHMEV
eukprot:s1034_g11.t1